MPMISLGKLLNENDQVAKDEASLPIFWVHDPIAEDFPDPDAAWGDDSPAPGLVALSAELSPDLTLKAYRKGIFPWFIESGVVHWYSPDPRLVLRTDGVRVRRSLQKKIRQVLRDPLVEIAVDRDFAGVIAACAEHPRPYAKGTWISPLIQQTYEQLHIQGHAHSVECWQNGVLVAGLYGVALGRMFYGESMFTQVSDYSKIVLVALCAFLVGQGVRLIDCQQATPHLQFMGGEAWSRSEFVHHLQSATILPPIPSWTFDQSILQTYV